MFSDTEQSMSLYTLFSKSSILLFFPRQLSSSYILSLDASGSQELGPVALEDWCLERRRCRRFGKGHGVGPRLTPSIYWVWGLSALISCSRGD